MSENEMEHYITQCYRKLLKRDPDPQGLSHYLKEIQEGRLSKEQLVNSLESSEEYTLLQMKHLFPPSSEKGGLVDVTQSDLTTKNIEKNLARLYDYLENCTIVPGPKEELRTYLEEAFYRFVKILQIVNPNIFGKLLEIGSNPYFLTTILKKFRKLDLDGVNFFSSSARSINQTVVNEKYGEQHTYHSKLFNIENDTFPYDNNSFDFVLICEVIEHLIKDPIHVLQEIHRILKPKGTIILTTPNVARASNIQKLEKGENIYDPYSRYGIYGRHNREYTVNELVELFTKTGFKIEMKFTKFVHFKYPDNNWWKLTDTDNYRGDYIFISAKKGEKFEDYRPAWLFR